MKKTVKKFLFYVSAFIMVIVTTGMLYLLLQAFAPSQNRVALFQTVGDGEVTLVLFDDVGDRPAEFTKIEISIKDSVDWKRARREELVSGQDGVFCAVKVKKDGYLAACERIDGGKAIPIAGAKFSGPNEVIQFARSIGKAARAAREKEDSNPEELVIKRAQGRVRS